MKKITVASLIIAACLSSNAMAKNHPHNDHGRFDDPRITEVTPMTHGSHRTLIKDVRHVGHQQGHGSEQHSKTPNLVEGIIAGVVVHTLISSALGGH